MDDEPPVYPEGSEEVPLSLEEERRKLAQLVGMEICDDLSGYLFPKELIRTIPYAFTQKHCAIPIAIEEKSVIIATADPLHLDVIEELRLLLSRPVKAVYTPREVLLAAIDAAYKGDEGAASALIANLGSGEGSSGESGHAVHDLLDEGQQASPIIRLLNLIIVEAIEQSASDIHFEPFEGKMRVRYRIDGVLQIRHMPAQEIQQPLITRIKVMAKLDIAEHRLPQDGRLKLRLGRREIDFRVSTLPVAGGERIVMRILDRGNVTLGLEQLGMSSTVYSQFRKLISVPEGIILVTGPTGSGKTTTLYSAITDLASDETNIITIEDPVEYNLRGIAQIAVKPKIQLTFAAGLRHILRQDPDVIMVGEIRDTETAEISIQASLTGHLVLSTLHTNDAPSAVVRLIDMGVVPYLLSSSVIGVLAQRLVRRVCRQCREAYVPSANELSAIGLSHNLHQDRPFYRGKGCAACLGVGFKGRHGIYELMVVSGAVKQAIVRSPDVQSMRQVAQDTGMVPMLADGARLVLEGITTPEEVLRVTRALE